MIDYFKQTIVFYFFTFFSLLACEGTETDQDGTLAPNATPADVFVKDTFVDKEASLSSDGSRVVFLSSRGDSQYKSYKFTVGTSTAPAPLTAQDLGEELSVTISPDGLWAAVKVLTPEGVFKLYIQSYDDTAKRLEVTDAGSSFQNPTFSHWSPPALSFYSQDALGTTSLKVVRFTIGSANTPTYAATQTATDYSAGETQLTWVNQTGYIGLLSRKWNAATGQLLFRSRSQLSGLGAATQIDGQNSGFSRMGTIPFAAGALGFVFNQDLESRSEKITPVTDKEGDIAAVFLRHKTYLSALDGTQITPIESKHYKTLSLTATQSSGVLGILGLEVFACQAAGAADFYGSSFILYNGTTTTKLFFKHDSDNTLKIVTADCEAFDKNLAPEQQLIDLTVNDLKLAGNYDGTTITFLLQTSRSGDEEIYHISAPYDGTTFGDATVTKISQNPRS